MSGGERSRYRIRSKAEKGERVVTGEPISQLGRASAWQHRGLQN
jgi:hypothetical protein